MNTTTRLLSWTLSACSLLVAAGAGAQDIHFAHLAAVPTQTNPAYAGLMEGRARVGIDYRGQWNNFTNGFQTASLSADVKLYENRHDVLGGGLHLTNDRAGDLAFTTQQVGLTNSYLKALDNGRTYLAFGVQNVLTFQQIDWTKANAFDFEPLEVLGSDGRRSYWDIGGGLSFFQRPSRYLSWFVGLAGAHLNKPTVTFLADNDGNVADQLFVKWTFHAGGEIKFGRFNSLRPSVLLLRQGPHRQLKVGTFYRFKTDNGIATDSEVAVHLGAFVRAYPAQERGGVDAIILAARFDYHHTVITVSFDTNVSSLTAASNGVGGPEFSLVQEFDWGTRGRRRHKVKCPTFQY